MAQIDDAEPVAFRVSEDDEVRVIRVEIPVDDFGTERNKTLGLDRLLCRRRDVQVEVGPGTNLGWRVTPLERELRPLARRWDENRRPAAEAVGATLVRERFTLEPRRALDVPHSQSNHANVKHRRTFARADTVRRPALDRQFGRGPPAGDVRA